MNGQPIHKYEQRTMQTLVSDFRACEAWLNSIDRKKSKAIKRPLKIYSTDLSHYTDHEIEVARYRYSRSIPQLEKEVALAQDKCNTQAIIVRKKRGKGKWWEERRLEYDTRHLAVVSEALVKARDCPIVDALDVIENHYTFGYLGAITQNFKYESSIRFNSRTEKEVFEHLWFLLTNNGDEWIEKEIAIAYEKSERISTDVNKWGGNDFNEFYKLAAEISHLKHALTIERLADVRMPNYECPPLNDNHLSLDRPRPNKNSQLVYDMDVSIKTLKVGDEIHMERDGARLATDPSTIVKIMPKTMIVSELDRTTKEMKERRVKKSAVIGSVTMAEFNPDDGDDRFQKYDASQIFHLITE